MRKLTIFFTAIFCLTITNLRADEGMWIPLLIEKYNISDMQSKGFKLTAEDIYSINQPSIKDAIVIFGRGCTGEVISPDGLLITNHHCSFGLIQSHSSVENDYLSDGFWAMSKEEELSNPNLSVRFLVRIEEVTDRVLKGIEPEEDEVVRDSIIRANSKEISDSVENDTHYSARVAPFFYGNQYFVFVYEEFTDVRLVGAPPQSIGKFGGDTDNWMWPRHTGDFALFRIYADENNKPAPYSPDNVPYEPKYHLPISLKGVQPGDFTMVYGYPGSTQQYITSDAVNQVVNVSNPLKISLRDARLEIMKNYMRQNDKVRIQYASKQAGVANAWKKWIGERNGLIRLDAIAKKQALESDFANWVSQSQQREQHYGNLLPEFKELYNLREPLLVARDVGREAFNAVEMIRFAGRYNRLIDKAINDTVADIEMAERLISSTRKFYKDYHKPIDMEVFSAMMESFTSILPDSLHPPLLKEQYQNANKSWEGIAEELYAHSVFADSSKLIQKLSSFDIEVAREMHKDIFLQLNYQFDSIYFDNIDLPYHFINKELNVLYRSYMRALMEMQPDKQFYPDANFTLRIAYGNVEGYSPSDAVTYTHQTTLNGIAEKSKMDVYDYKVPDKLLNIIETEDYGRWEVDGTVPVAFLASNHTSGGNSGSPVINAQGHLIGVNFDRVWEGTMSDIMFDPEMCRNITLDIRYALFIIDKFAGAGYLLDELTLVD